MSFVKFRGLAVAGLSICLSATMASAQKLPPPSSQTAARADDVSIEGYQQHLARLESLLEACANGRDAKTCDPALIGADDRVPVIVDAVAERRAVRYGWLRVLFQKACH